MKIYTKRDLIEALKEIRNRGWIPNYRPGNVGGIGNTLEDLLDIKENNLPIPNASEWELKCFRKDSNSLITLFHMEPSPRALKFVPKILLPKYGWKHELAGIKYPPDEMSFRQTIHCLERSDRGFKVNVDHDNKRIVISFDATRVDCKHSEWLKSVSKRVGLNEIDPQPYWGFDDLFHKAGTKILNVFCIEADVKKTAVEEFFHYNRIMILQNFSKKRFIKAIENGSVLIDFDARTGHNHGTKFRLRKSCLAELYDDVNIIE